LRCCRPLPPGPVSRQSAPSNRFPAFFLRSINGSAFRDPSTPWHRVEPLLGFLGGLEISSWIAIL
jgi:hypothetical protein